MVKATLFTIIVVDTIIIANAFFYYCFLDLSAGGVHVHKEMRLHFSCTFIRAAEHDVLKPESGHDRNKRSFF